MLGLGLGLVFGGGNSVVEPVVTAMVGFVDGCLRRPSGGTAIPAAFR